MSLHESFGPVPAEAIQEALAAPVGASVKIIRKFAPYFAFTSDDYENEINSKVDKIYDEKLRITENRSAIRDFEAALQADLPCRVSDLLRSKILSCKCNIQYADSTVKALESEIQSLKSYASNPAKRDNRHRDSGN